MIVSAVGFAVALVLLKSVLWTYSTAGSPIESSPLVVDGLAYVGDWNGILHAVDVETGEELFRHRMPYAGTAVPATYRTRKDGRQFVVIASGGNPVGDMGDALIAYALPE